MDLTAVTGSSIHNSPALVASPNDRSKLVVANRVDAPAFSCSFHGSSNAGADWRPLKLSFPESDGIPCATPDAAFTGDGKLHVSYVSFAKVGEHGSRPYAVWVANEGDEAGEFEKPVSIAGENAFHVRLVADPKVPGRLYAVWLQAAGTGTWGLPTDGNPIVLSSSNDGGKTWRKPIQVSDEAHRRAVAPSIAIGKDGDVLVSYLDLGKDMLDYEGGHEGNGGEPYPGKWSLVLAKSQNAGASWDHSIVEDKLTPTQRFLMLFPPTPSLATDVDSGAIYVGFQDKGGSGVDAFVWSSDDGDEWTKTQVNGAKKADKTWQYLPSLAVAPNGRLDVLYFDRRADPKNVLNEVSLQSSYDGGATFEPRFRVSDVAFTSGLGFGTDRGIPEFGNRLGLVSADQGSIAAWTDSRNTHPAFFRQEIAYTRIRQSEPNLETPLKVAGRVLLFGSEILLAIILFLRLKPRPKEPPKANLVV